MAGSSAGTVVTLRIDGQDISAHDDQTIMQAADDHGIPIPRLCSIEGLSTVGACRMCLVEVAGFDKLTAACATQVTEGMNVTANSERMQHYRRMVLEMLFSERNHICAVCVSNGRCELQGLAQTHGMTHTSLPYIYPTHDVDASHERYKIDHDRCILCTRCVRVCDEIEGAHTLDVMGRGVDSKLITDLNEPWGDSETCTSCGKCVAVCPTGALSFRGTSVGEQKKSRQFLPYLTRMREGRE